MEIIQHLRPHPGGEPNVTHTYLNLSEVEPVLTRTIGSRVYKIIMIGKYMMDDLNRFTKLDDEAFKMMSELQAYRQRKEIKC